MSVRSWASIRIPRCYPNGLFFKMHCPVLVYMAQYCWVKEKTRSSDPVHASSVRNKTLVDSLPDIITAADKVKCLITCIWTYTGAVSLDITSGSMASGTVEGFYITLVNCVQYLSGYFKYTGKENILSEIRKTLGTRTIEGFYGHITEKNPEKTQHFCSFPNVWPLRLSTS